MSSLSAPTLLEQTLEALKALDRRKAVALLQQDMESAAPGGKRWLSVAQLAATIGEKGLELDALQKLSQTIPQTLDHVLAYAQGLVRFGRRDLAMQMISALPEEVRNHPALLHFRAMAASESGNVTAAEAAFRQALATAPTLAQSWQGLASIKTFTPDDPDIAAMEQARPQFHHAPSDVKATFLYALAKAYDDAGDIARATQTYLEGAASMRSALPPYNVRAWLDFASQTVRDYSLTQMGQLMPSGCTSDRVTFVTGLPRSGTMLASQILTAHSTVRGGGELNFVEGAFLAAGDFSLAGAMAYQRRDGGSDPWGDAARGYLNVVTQRFGTKGRVVDNTLNLSRMMGLLLHSLPNARVIWLRRDPEDNALSIFRTPFRNSVPWSRSLTDIAGHMLGEDILYHHWASLFPDRILTVPYEDLARQPEVWNGRLLAHAGLPIGTEAAAHHAGSEETSANGMTQVPAPISVSRIGVAERYGDFMAPFRTAYRG